MRSGSFQRLSRTSLLASLLVIAVVPRARSVIVVTGQVRSEGSKHHTGPVIVQAFANPLDDGNPVVTTKLDVYRGRSFASATASADGQFSIELPSASNGSFFSFFAFDDVDANGKLDIGDLEPCSWVTDGDGWWMSPTQVTGPGLSGLQLTLPTVSPMPTAAVEGRSSLRRLKNHTVLSLVGNATERGFAHGRMLGPQIVQVRCAPPPPPPQSR
jgi:hypothetical protein